MRIIEAGNFSEVTDPVKTEETINLQLIREAANIHTDYIYVSLPLAWNINQEGSQNTQKRINDICEAHIDEKLFFVCQHILVDRLNFHGNLVFTPHATLLDSFIPIPHYSCNYDTSFSRPWNEREYKFSFMGDFGTHQTRKHIYNILKDQPNTVFIDTKRWHFYSNSKTQSINKKNYIELLGNTKYSLCPRGTGPSTIRIWEAIAMNSCPIIFSDYLKMPLKLIIKTDLWLKIAEHCVNIKEDYVEDYNNKEYWDWFSNENLYKSIVSAIT